MSLLGNVTLLRMVSTEAPDGKRYLNMNINAQKTILDTYLLHEYRDLFIDMDVRNNRSELRQFH